MELGEEISEGLILLSVQFNLSVMSDSLRPHWLQHARLPCPSPTPGAYSNSSPLSWWCHPTISSSVIPFSSHLRSFPGSGSWSFSFSISPSNEHPGPISFRMAWLELLAVQGTLKSLLQHYSSKASIFWRSAYCLLNSHFMLLYEFWQEAQCFQVLRRW